MTTNAKEPVSDCIDWRGGYTPPVDPLDTVEVEYRSAADPAKGVRIDWPMIATAFSWHHDGQDDDIVRYRVVRP